MGIEGFDLKVPVVLFAVGLKELEAGREGPRLGGELLLLHVLSVHPVLADDAAQMLGHLRIGDLAFPGIALLAAHVLPARIAVVVGGAAVFPVVVVVRDKVRVDAVAFQDCESGVVERLVRPPGTVQEVVPAGVQLPACRHARHGADVVVVESNRALAQADEVGGERPVAAVVRQHVPVQRVVHDHYSFHAAASSIELDFLKQASASLRRKP